MVSWEQIKGDVDAAADDLTEEQQQKLTGYLKQFKGNGQKLSENSLKAISGAINAKIEDYKQENATNN